MADDELEKLLGETEVTPQAPPEEKKVETSTVVSQEQQQIESELEAKKRQLEDLDRAKREALTELSKIRKAKQQAKLGVVDEDEYLPKIDLEDPSAAAWDKHIRKSVRPMESELEQEKQEVLDLSLKRFLANKPALAKNSEQLKELMETYESLSSGKITGRNSEVVEVYLDKAYAAVNHQQLFSDIKSKRINRVVEDELFSSPGISSGAGSYVSPSEEVVEPKLSRDQLEIIMKWKPPEQDSREYLKQYMADKKKYKQ